jgi:hypothetical protein
MGRQLRRVQQVDFDQHVFHGTRGFALGTDTPVQKHRTTLSHNSQSDTNLVRPLVENRRQYVAPTLHS